MELYLPVKQPIDQNNLFGTSSPMYTALHQLGHPGVDFDCPSGTPVYSPCDGAAFYATDANGGCGIYIRTPDSPNPGYNIILWHMYPAGTEGFPYSISTEKGAVTDVKAGQLLGYSDNSGYPVESTGSHLHLGVMPIGANELALDPTNGFLGCVNPEPFLSTSYAEDINNPPPPITPEVVAVATEAVKEIAVLPAAPSVKETLLQEISAILDKYL
jgi:murein DD-endopeptidase MepM/ murein hydrolase activator NlpD